mgnify:CR=1 FL=1
MTEQLTVPVKVEHIEHLALIAQIELHSYYVIDDGGPFG